MERVVNSKYGFNMNKTKYVIVVVYLIFLVVSYLSISLPLSPNETGGDSVRRYVASSVNPMVSNSTKKAM